MRGSIEDMIAAMQARVDELEGGVTSATDIKAANIHRDEAYLNKLCKAIDNVISEAGYVSETTIDDWSYPEGLLTIFDQDGFSFSFPISDIVANWDDIENDADIIAQDAIEAYEDSWK